ncbi:MAG: tetratricopeptide repeat protein, partial [Desulfobacterales bacterium]|nr:tetratricopeptide repeat protein [Desulfobacterales bacterium]
MKRLDMRTILSVWVLINLFIAGCAKPQQHQPRMEDVKNYNKQGISYGKKGQYDQAISNFNKALEINPKLAVVYYNRGLAFDNKGQYDQAISDYTKAIELNQRYADAYYNRGLAFDNKGQ